MASGRGGRGTGGSSTSGSVAVPWVTKNCSKPPDVFDQREAVRRFLAGEAHTETQAQEVVGVARGGTNEVSRHGRSLHDVLPVWRQPARLSALADTLSSRRRRGGGAAPGGHPEPAGRPEFAGALPGVWRVLARNPRF